MTEPTCIPLPLPDCAITVYFRQSKPEPDVPPTFSFSYCCANSARGWHVEPTGGIHPPPTSRIIQFRLYGGGELSFGGLRIATEEKKCPSGHYWTPRSTLKKLGIDVLTPSQYPPRDKCTAEPLTLKFKAAGPKSQLSQLFYSLAVSVDGGEPRWDDPRIYDDGSQ
jgi:hypothetical protein